MFVDNFPKFQEKIKIVPNCIDVDEYKHCGKTTDSNSLIFSGSFTYNVNYEAMCWFIENVYPRIIDQIPNVNLIISGHHANKPLPSQKNITLAGYVDDIKSLIASCSVSIVPILSGGGTRLKILEAMAIGTPVVATSKGVEGLLARDGEHILVADEPQKFAEYVIQLLVNKNLRNHLSSNALQLVKDQYNWPKVLPEFLNLIEKAVLG